MPSSYIVPNVGVMASTGLVDEDVAKVLQLLILQSLGVDTTTDPDAFERVRISWPTDGQPAWLISEDLCFIRVSEAQEPYNYAHEVQQAGEYDNTGDYAEETIYTRGWDVHLIFYGPNSFDHARQVKTCLFQDFFATALSAVNLYEITTIGTPRRTPELYAADWWQRSDLSFRMYEQVTETISKPAVDSVDLHIHDATGLGSDIVIEDPQQ